MSYDIKLVDPITGKCLELDEPHHMRGGTYQTGETLQANLNITWNYGDAFRRVIGDQGVRTIYGMTGAESIPVLQSANSQLSDDVDDDYWKATDGNAKRALLQLLVLARMRPNGIWKGN